MENMLQQLSETKLFLTEKGFTGARAGIVLGTGLGTFIQSVTIEKKIAYKDIPHFPIATVEFHEGQLLLGEVGGLKVLIMQGRFHYYEGYTMQQITFPVRVMQELGIEYLLLSNAAGGLAPQFAKGDLVLLTDHINLLPENPLRGLNEASFGNRFVDMYQPYNEMLNLHLELAAQKLGIELKKGIYAAVMGPNLETKAEYRYLRTIGADMVGMSTVPEVIVCNHMGLACAAISVITDECDPDNLQPVKIEEIIAVAKNADSRLSKVFEELISNIGTYIKRSES